MGNCFARQDPSHNVQSVSSAPPLSSPSTGFSRPSSSVPPQRTTLQKHVIKPKTFYVPSIQRPVLDLSPSSTTPESVVKRALLSDNPSQNTIALVGMGGVGKSTVLCALGRDKDIWAKFQDTVYFIELGHDITLSSFVRQLQQIVQSVLPEFVEQFKELAASDDTHRSMISQLMDRLTSTRCLLLLDDVWDVNASVYNLVCVMSKAVEGNDNSSLKMLTSTRSRDIADELRTFTVSINPEELDTDKTLRIFCHHARIETSDVSSLSPQNQDALNSIVETCAGLPLALSVAGSGVRQQMDPSSNVCDESAFGLYWERLKTKPGQVAGAEGRGGHKGLTNALETSVQFLEERWESTKRTEELVDELSARDMFRSLCIMEKQKILPVCVIERLWGVSDVEAGVMMLSRNSLVSEVREGGQGAVAVRVHDLVLDLSVKMSEGEGGTMKWHGRLVDSFEVSGNGRTGDSEIEEEEWWKLKNTESEKYMREHVVRHLLGARRVYNALKLLTDYRWIEEMNKDEERTPFRKVIAEVEMLRKYLEEEEEKTENVERIVRDLAVIVRAMERSMMPYCVKNRDECTYQLFGRLRDVVSESGVVERIVCSIERYGERPWARCGPGVLESGRSGLRGVLKLEGDGKCMCVGTGGEVIVGGEEGEIWVLDGGDGTVRKALVHRAGYPVVSVFFDRSKGLIYSCDYTGQVTIWKNEEKWRTMQVELEDEEDEISCMQVLLSLKKVVLGTRKGRLFVMDIPRGSVVQTVAAHDDVVNSLAIVGSEHVMVSASRDGTIRAWHTESFEDTGAVFEGHTKPVDSVALSADGRLLASASWDRSVRVWDVQSGEQLWKSPDAHHNYVECVLFSGDGRLLFSADSMKTSVWRVDNDGRHVSLVDTRPYLSLRDVRSVCLGDGSDLFVLTRNEVQVWDVRQVGNTIESVSPFLPDVCKFGISEDGSTMLTFNVRWNLMEIRNVCDVSERIDRVILSVTISDAHHWPQIFAVSNDQRFVAYSHHRSCVVYIVDSRNGNVLHSLPDLEEWALSLASAEQDEASNSSSSGDSSSGTRRKVQRGIGRLSFSADGNIVSASATAITNPFDNNRSVVHTKSMSWNVQSGEALDEAQLNGDSTAMSSAETPHLVCNKKLDGWSFEYSPNVTYRRGASSSIIATVEGHVGGAHYIADSSRLHLLTRERGMFYIDLITANTQIPSRDEPPPIPFLSQSHPHQSKNTGTDTGTDEVYDIFISHAGPDKFTIALPLYNLLVALGFKVFLDRAELRPGEDAPEKMIKAMHTAKIAVVILSPEYAARKWTLKELMCFVERFRAGGEGSVIIIPVFYRLTLDDCRDKNTLFEVVNDSGENVFVAEGFLKWMVEQQELSIEKVLKVLQSLRGVTGIENEGKVTNGESEEEKAAQTQFVEKIRDAIVEAMGRLKSGRGAGPSSARG